MEFFSENISFLTIQKPSGFGRVSESGSRFFGSSIKSRVRVSACKKKSSSGFCRVRPRPVASLICIAKILKLNTNYFKEI